MINPSDFKSALRTLGLAWQPRWGWIRHSLRRTVCLLALPLGFLLVGGCKDNKNKEHYFSYEEALAFTTMSWVEEDIIEVIGTTNGMFTYGLSATLVSSTNGTQGVSITSLKGKKNTFKLSFSGQEASETWPDESEEKKISWTTPRAELGEFHAYPFHNQDGDPLLVIKQRKKSNAEDAND